MSKIIQSKNAERIELLMRYNGYTVVSTNIEHRLYSSVMYISELDHAWLIENNYSFHIRRQFENGSYEFLVMAPKDGGK